MGSWHSESSAIAADRLEKMESTMQTVLVVEDNRLVKVVHERLLSRAGYKVVTAADGEEALKVAQETSPDVILLDMMLPKLSGQQVLRELKGDPATEHIPVIIVTCLSKRNAPKLKAEGAEAFVEKEDLVATQKPLLDVVRRVLRNAASGKVGQVRAVELPWAVAGVKPGAGATKGI
jgi:CheY-like chemotaxis protein